MYLYCYLSLYGISLHITCRFATHLYMYVFFICLLMIYSKAFVLHEHVHICIDTCTCRCVCLNLYHIRKLSSGKHGMDSWGYHGGVLGLIEESIPACAANKRRESPAKAGGSFAVLRALHPPWSLQPRNMSEAGFWCVGSNTNRLGLLPRLDAFCLHPQRY